MKNHISFDMTVPMEWISIKDAAELIGKSEISIRRLLYKLDKASDKSIVFKKAKATRGYQWFIDKASLLSYFQYDKPDDSQNDKLVEFLKNENEYLKNEIRIKNEQINHLQILLMRSQEKPQEIEHKSQGIIGAIVNRILR